MSIWDWVLWGEGGNYCFTNDVLITAVCVDCHVNVNGGRVSTLRYTSALSELSQRPSSAIYLCSFTCHAGEHAYISRG